MNVLSLFDGMSCGQLALKKLDIHVDNYFASEIDKYAMQVTKANFPNTKHIGDVTKVKGSDLPQIDLLIGGSPCQGFSFAGKQLNFEDPRSKLFFEFVRLIEECKPVYFFLENVKMKKEYEAVITQHLGVDPIEINSALVSAQNRPRIYWTNIPNIEQPKDRGITYGSIADFKGDILSQRAEERTKTNKRVRTITSLADKVPTILRNQSKKSTDSVRINVSGEWRWLSLLESERAQTLPDGYTIQAPNTHRFEMIGNGWTVDVIAHMFNNLPYF